MPKMTLKEITENNSPVLMKCIDPSVDLLSRLRAVPYVKDQITRIKQQVTDALKNDTLLDVLCEVPDDIQESVMNGFILALRSSGQDHVANIFRRESDKVPMSEEHCRALTGKINQLCKFIDPENGLLDVLLGADIISHVNVQDIRSMSGHNQMARKLIEVLTRKSDDAYNGLIDALNETGQSHVTCMLTGDEGSDKVPMSEEHYRTMSGKIDQLCQCIDPENGLLDKLVSTGVISFADAHNIRSMSGYNGMARKLIEVLIRKPDDAFDGFIKALNLKGQPHVTYMLTGDGNSRPLKEEYRCRLMERPRNDLVQMIDSRNSGLVTALMDKGVFSTYDQQRATSTQPDTFYDRNEIILDLIARKSQSDFFQFISALNDTHQTHVVVNLLGAEVVAKIKTIYESGTQDVDHTCHVDVDLMEYMREMFQSNGNVVRQLNEILSQNGISVSDVRQGCIEVKFACRSVESLRYFRDLNDSGHLEKMINEAFCFPFAQKGLKSLQVKVSGEQFEQCSEMFNCWAPMTAGHHDALLSSAEWLVDKIRVNSDLLDKLSLCGRRRQAIKSAATHRPKQQVKTLIDIVSRQPDSAFEQLLNALKDTNQHEAVNIIISDSRSPRKSSGAEHESLTEHAWEQVDHNLERLVQLMKCNISEKGNLPRQVTFCHICTTLSDHVMSLHNLREMSFVPTSRLTINEELEQLFHLSSRQSVDITQEKETLLQKLEQKSQRLEQTNRTLTNCNRNLERASRTLQQRNKELEDCVIWLLQTEETRSAELDKDMALWSARSDLMKTVTMNEQLLFELVSNMVITPTMKQHIDEEATNEDKVGKLLDLLENRGSDIFNEFVKVLERTDQLQAALTLTEAQVKCQLWCLRNLRPINDDPGYATADERPPLI